VGTWVVRDFLHRIRHLNETGWFSVDAYVVCLCEVDDLLSQWRGYGDRGAVSPLVLALTPVPHASSSRPPR